MIRALHALIHNSLSWVQLILFIIEHTKLVVDNAVHAFWHNSKHIVVFSFLNPTTYSGNRFYFHKCAVVYELPLHNFPLFGRPYSSQPTTPMVIDKNPPGIRVRQSSNHHDFHIVRFRIRSLSRFLCVNPRSEYWQPLVWLTFTVPANVAYLKRQGSGPALTSIHFIFIHLQPALQLSVVWFQKWNVTCFPHIAHTFYKC